MTLDSFCLESARLDEARVRHAGAVHYEPQPEELVEHSNDNDERGNGETGDLQYRANHSVPLSAQAGVPLSARLKPALYGCGLFTAYFAPPTVSVRWRM
jgi:hypothetical protein